MVDPQNITNFNLTHPELEERILFWLFAAGHNARSTARALNKLLKNLENGNSVNSPFENIRIFLCDLKNTSVITTKNKVEDFYTLLSTSGLGCWKQKAPTIISLAYSKINLKTCSLDDLMSFKYIGPKTARCFLLHSRPNMPYAGLDTHILKHLKANGVNVPKGTPTKKNYSKLEEVVLKMAQAAGKTTAEFDLEIWKRYAK